MKSFIIFFIAFSLLFLIVDVLQRKIFKKLIWARKATHIGAGVLSYFMPIFLNKEQVLLISILFTIILILSKWKKILFLHNVKRNTLGEIYYPISIAILSIICLPDNIIAFQSAVLILSFSDGLAGLIGEKINFQQITIWGNKKSIGGSIIFFLASIVIFTFMHGFILDKLLLVIVISGILTIVEFFSFNGTDNLVVPILAALLDMTFLI